MKHPKRQSFYLTFPIDYEDALVLIKAMSKLTTFRYVAMKFDTTRPHERRHPSVRWLKEVCDGKKK